MGHKYQVYKVQTNNYRNTMTTYNPSLCTHDFVPNIDNSRPDRYSNSKCLCTNSKCPTCHPRNRANCIKKSCKPPFLPPGPPNSNRPPCHDNYTRGPCQRRLARARNTSYDYNPYPGNERIMLSPSRYGHRIDDYDDDEIYPDDHYMPMPNSGMSNPLDRRSPPRYCQNPMRACNRISDREQSNDPYEFNNMGSNNYSDVHRIKGGSYSDMISQRQSFYNPNDFEESRDTRFPSYRNRPPTPPRSYRNRPTPPTSSYGNRPLSPPRSHGNRSCKSKTFSTEPKISNNDLLNWIPQPCRGCGKYQSSSFDSYDGPSIRFEVPQKDKNTAHLGKQY